MKLCNNTHKYLFYYISNQQLYGILSFGCQIESSQQIIAFHDLEAWKNYITEQLGNSSWYNEEQIQATIAAMVVSNNGYLTQYGYRLRVDTTTEQKLDQLLLSNDNTIVFTTMSGDVASLQREDFIDMVNQYKIDKPLYLAVLESL